MLKQQDEGIFHVTDKEAKTWVVFYVRATGSDKVYLDYYFGGTEEADYEDTIDYLNYVCQADIALDDLIDFAVHQVEEV